MPRSCFILAFVASLSCGCTHVQLQKNMVNQAGTLSDIYTQQVMDNLARFVYEFDSMPDFAVPSSGTNSVNDSVATNGGLTWNTFNFTGASLGANGSRAMSQAWTLQAVNDPRKLQLMRCAYQYAVASCGLETPPTSCPDCDRLVEAFHAYDARAGGIGDQCVKNLRGNAWFGVGTKHEVPTNCGTAYVGHYAGVYVWVLPEHWDKLTVLTLAILNYALNDPPKQAGKSVEVTTERDGEGNTVRVVRKETSVEGVVKDGQPVFLRPEPSAMTPDLRELELRLDLLR